MKKIKYFVPALIMMIFIFYMSHQSADTSNQTSNFFVNLLITNFNLSSDLLSIIIRKGAHMTEYAILVALLYYGFSHTFPNNAYLKSMMIGVLYACSDEFHQLFIDGRSGQCKDVLIDTFGMIIGLLLIYATLKNIANKKKSPN